MSADVTPRKAVADLLDVIAERKNKCAFCGEQLWFVRTSTPTPKLIAVDDTARNHFSPTHVEPDGTRRTR